MDSKRGDATDMLIDRASEQGWDGPSALAVTVEFIEQKGMTKEFKEFLDSPVIVMWNGKARIRHEED